MADTWDETDTGDWYDTTTDTTVDVSGTGVYETVPDYTNDLYEDNIKPGQAVQIGENWYFPKDDGTYSVNGGSSTISAEALSRLNLGDASVNPLGSGTVVGSDVNAPSGTPETVSKGFLDRLTGAAGKAITDRYTDPTTKAIDWTKVAKDAAAAYSLTLDTTPKPQGYNVPIPELNMTRQQVMPNDPNRRAGSGGLDYFTDPKYAKQGDTVAQSAADYADTQQAKGIKDAYNRAPAQINPWAGKAVPTAALTTTAQNPMTQAAPAKPLTVPTATLPNVARPMAAGGLASFAHGGNNYLQGPTDGMADKLDTTIDDTQAAKLSHGEFVIPADVVSHLGNGNSDAGAKKLYSMMAKIRKARTGNSEQGKRINPDKFMPGGLAQYSGGGAIAFDAGGVTTPPATTPASTSTTDVLSEWAGPAVSGMLSKGIAASNAPYQSYQGPLTAGPSDLQNQAFAGASDLAKTGYTPTNFTTGTFDTAAANKYMNPYLQASLNPQLKELQRQSQINNVANAGKLTQAGAFGGSRQAIMGGEENRNLLDKSQDLIGQGYNTAYNNAMNQFNTEQGRGMDAQKASEASRVYGADYGMKSIQNLADLGNTQRNIEQEGLTADKTQFEQQRDNPLKMAQYQKDLLTGLPITTQNKNVNTSEYTNVLGKLNDLQTLMGRLGATTP
jgi:hypothetical protein